MLLNIQKKLIVFAMYFVAFTSYAQQITVSETAGINSFPLLANGQKATIIYDPNDSKVVATASRLFAEDLHLITPTALGNVQTNQPYKVIIGTLGKSKLIDQLVKTGKIQTSGIKDQWETFQISVVENLSADTKKALVIAGSDPRGTAFGVFELSRLMGVHPLYWWADVPVKKHLALHISGSYTSNTPSVKYRGIFLNDEDWGLQPWAAKTFEPETGDIGPKTYARIFELLLRLKGNLIWPAMHPSTKAFYSYPGNKQVAEEYAIIVGSSHAEPMLRNNVGEWNKKNMGDFNYITNKDNVFKYWEDRVKESSSNDAIYTLGMRGIHDSGIEGVKSNKEAIPLVERIIQDQRGLLAKYINKDVTKVPQAFTAYKEVLDIYDAGLKIPDDVTLVWPDDNYGYIHRLNNEKEAARPGRSGVYYHASYWGRPHDYLWLSSTHPALIREEMMKAYTNESNKLWVLNVGDIKPLEYNTQLFMDMAYRAEPFKDPAYVQTHLSDWLGGIFGKNRSKVLGDILWEYYRLAFERRPEFMGWSQTEPTTQTTYTSYNHFYFGDEAQRRIDAYNQLEKTVKALRTEIMPDQADAFYQLVYYPVIGASQMNKKFLYRDKAWLYAKQNRSSAKDYAALSQQAYETILAETNYYNTKLANGKWNQMMSAAPRDLPVFKAPVIASIISTSKGSWDVIPEGWARTDSAVNTDLTSKLQLPAFNKAVPSRYFIDIFLSEDKELSWTASVKAKWIKLSETAGTLKPETGKRESRIWVEIDWNAAPSQTTFESAIEFKADGKKKSIAVKALNDQTLARSGTFAESNELISIFASNFSNKANEWILTPGLGHTGASLTSSVSASFASNPASAPVVEYEFYNSTSAPAEVAVFTLPTHPLNNNFSMSYGISVDGSEIKVVDFKTQNRSNEWKQNVLSNTAVRKIKTNTLTPGKHSLKIYAVDPGVILDRIVIDLGATVKSYGVIPETKTSNK